MAQTLAALADKLAQVSDIYAGRFEIARDDDWFALKIAEEAGELVAEYLRLTGRARRKDMSEADIRAALAEEAADVIAMTLLFARHHGIDIDAAIAGKWLRYLPEKSQ